MGTGFRVNGDVVLPDGRTLRIFAQANKPDGATIAGGNLSAQIIGSSEYFQAFACQHMKFTSPTKCEASAEGRIGRVRSLMTLSLEDQSDLLTVNISKNGVAWVTMSSPQPIRQSETDPAETGEYVRLFPPS